MKKLLYFVPALLLAVTALGRQLNGPSGTSEQIRMNLYGFYPDSSTYVLDGTLTRYSDSYSNDIDINDSRKLYNSGENISMIRSGIDLIVECRKTIATTDTIFFRMWGMQKKSYRMEFVARNLNHPGLEGYLEDSYLHTSSPIQLNDTTRFTITINNDPGSYAQDRFRVIFNTPAPAVPSVPHYTSVKATEMNSSILLTWNTINQNDVKAYFVDKSSDGIHFSPAATLPASAVANIYNWTDRYPADQVNFYRVGTETNSGTVDYAPVVSIKAGIATGVSLYPNPATSNNLNIRFSNDPPGAYQILLINSDGRILASEPYNYAGGMAVKKLEIHSVVAPGLYHVEVRGAGTTKVLGVVL